jgi:hypothetical protein
MPKTWSKEELHDVLTHATPIVRKFLKGLASKGTATAAELTVPHMAAVIGRRYEKSRGKEPLYSSVKDEATGKSAFTIEPKYKRTIAAFLATFKEPPAQPRRRARRVAAAAMTPRRGPGRPRKAVAAMESRTDGSFALPPDAAGDMPFWMGLVSFVNDAAQAKKTLWVTTDGADVLVVAAK